MRHRARTDKGHKAIVAALRKVGCQVFDTSRLGGGFPDLVVRRAVASRTSSYGTEARLMLMEVKEPKGKLTPDQEAFLRDWPEVMIVRSVAEALEAVGVQ